METKNMIGGIVSLAVVVICVAAIMMPVLNDATTTEKTFTNEGVFNYGVFTPEDTYTLSYTQSDGSILVNETAVTPIAGVSATESNSYSVLATDNVLLRYSYNNSGYILQIVGVDNTDDAVVRAGETLTATITGGALEITYLLNETTTTLTFEFEEMYAIVPDTDEAVLKVSSSEVYIKGDSEIYASGLTNVASWSNMFHFEGTYDDGITISSPNLSGATFDNIVWNLEAVDGYEDLYKLTSIEFDITYDDTTVHATYSYFAVPSEVTSELSQHLDSGEIAILNAIPVMVIAALIIGAVGIFITARRD